jgi:hypothetical protein
MNRAIAVRIGVALTLVAAYAYVGYALHRGFTNPYSAISLAFLILGAAILCLPSAGISTRSFILGVITIFCVRYALGAGGMYAGCDLGMRPFILEMIALFGTIALINPLDGLPFFGASICAAAAIERLQRNSLGQIKLPVFTAFLLGGMPALAYICYAILNLTGTHPTPGACVV